MYQRGGRHIKFVPYHFMYPLQFTGQILQRYGLPTGHFVREETENLRELVMELAHAFESPDQFDPRVFLDFPPELVVDYIRRTHRLYLFRKLPEMEQSIELLLGDYQSGHPLLTILHDFYSSYKLSLSLHICEEEQHLLPFVDYLIRAHKNGFDSYDYLKQSKRYVLEEFEDDHHDDSERSLDEIRATIAMYEPPVTNETPYRILLKQMENFSLDLHIHGKIEDLVLLPLMKEIQQDLDKEFNRRIPLT